MNPDKIKCNECGCVHTLEQIKLDEIRFYRVNQKLLCELCHEDHLERKYDCD
jgi:hypothetical protein